MGVLTPAKMGWLAVILLGMAFGVVQAQAGVISATTTHSVVGEVFPDAGVFTFGSGGADVGGTSSYDVTRGFAEFDLNGMGGPFASAQVSFRTGAVHSCCVGNGILIDGYKGDGLADISDFEAATTGNIGSFDDVDAGPSTWFSFDVTALVNAAIAAADPFFGIRLGGDSPWDYNSFLSFTDFRIDTVEAAVLKAAYVPEPGTLALIVIGLGGFAFLSRRRSRAALR